MKRKVLSLIICTVLALSQASFASAEVNSETSQKSAANNVSLSSSKLSSSSATSDYAASVNSVIKSVAPNIIVDKQYTGENGNKVDGIAYYNTVQGAIDSIGKNNTEEKIIFIKNGVYKEKIKISTPNITLVGESSERTILTYDDAAGTIMRAEDGGDGTKTYGTAGTACVRVTADAKKFTAANLTMSNSFDEAANSAMKSKQAISLYDDADESVLVNCKFLGNQDTLCAYTNRQYYYNCFIEGDVDFIFGGAQAVFKNCEIRSIDRDGVTPKGYVTAPSTQKSNNYGYLFEDCKLTSNITEKGSVYLGRPWYAGANPSTVICNSVYKNCYIGAHISTDGWSTMPNSGVTAYPKDYKMYEYNNYGPGAVNTGNDNRKLLTDAQAAIYTDENVLNGWNPMSTVNKLSSYKENNSDYSASENYDLYIDKTKSVDTDTSQANNNGIDKQSKKEWNKNEDGTWSFLDSKGEKTTGWLKWNNAWYHLNSAGAMEKGWITDNGKWYHLNEDGTMITGWFYDTDGKCYYFYESGEMSVNTNIDGYEIDENGVCTY